MTQTYGHPTKPHAVTSRSDGLTMTYDANGNMITKGTQSLAYDAENRLIQVTSGGITQASFVYDGDGGRVKKVTAAGPTTYVGKLWEVKPDGTTVKYIWAGSQRLCSKSSTGATLFYAPNHLGSTDLVTDAAGTQVAHYEYTPYGELFSTEGQVSVPHKFTGKELDPETGFYFYEARYYDPQLGRFLTPDTIIPSPSNPQTFNRYTYANNNPVVYTDPTGHKGWNPFRHLARWLGPIGRTVVSAVVAAAVFVVSGGNVALAAMAYAGTNTFLNASAQGASYLQAMGYATAAVAAAYVGAQIGGAIGGTFGTFWAGVGAGAGGGAAGGATTAATLGGNIGLAAASGAVAGAIGGAVGGLKLEGWARLAAGAAGSAAGGAAAGAIVGDPGAGALGGFASFAAFAIASGQFQAAMDAGRARAGVAADGPMATKVMVEHASPTRTFAPRQMGAEGSEAQLRSTLTVKMPSPLGEGIISGSLIGGGVGIMGVGLRTGSAPITIAGGVITLAGVAMELHSLASLPDVARTAAESIWEASGLKEYYDRLATTQ